MNTYGNKRWLWGLAVGVVVLVSATGPALAQHKGGRDDGRDKRDHSRQSQKYDHRDNRDRRDDRKHDQHRHHDHRDSHKGGSKNQVNFRVTFGGHAHTPVVQQRWIPGYYEDRVETVCIEPERYETRYIPAVTETRYNHRGEPYLVVIYPARHETVLVPARYEQRVVRVYVPGYYERVAVSHHDHKPRITIGVGGVFKF